MGFSLNKPYWDSTELKKEGIVNIVPIVSSGGQKRTERGCLADLKLGRLGDLKDQLINGSKDPRVFVMDSSSSSSGSSKRARVPCSGTNVVSCLVDGCNSDLSKCRDYHRRHKVCEVHSKTPKVTIGGNEQRFCQQCSRFHSLVEFDEGKRSCRKRLDGHNRRRRKPQPESLSLNSGRFFSNHQGSRFFPFTSPQVFSTSAVTSSDWDGAIKIENDAMIYTSHQQLNFIDRKNYFPGSFSHSYKGGKQISFLQDTGSTLPGVSVSQPVHNPNSTSKNGGSSSSSREMFSDRSNNQAIESDRALSLLSSQPAETRQISLNHMVQPDSNLPAQSLISSLQYDGVGVDVGAVDSILVANGGSSNVNLQCQGMFQSGAGGLSACESHQTIYFSWE